MRIRYFVLVETGSDERDIAISVVSFESPFRERLSEDGRMRDLF
jgi:hypothetical protein